MAVQPGREPMCVTALTLDFGPITSLPYRGAAQPDADIYVTAGGGIGSVGLESASRDGAAVTFRFSAASAAAPGDAHPPVCPGKSSFFCGLASRRTPIATNAQIHMGTYGWQQVGARRAGP